MKHWLIALTLFATTVHADLDEIPGPVVPTADLPAPAQWPAWRRDQPLRLLALCSKGEVLAPYERIARRMQASFDVRYVSGTNADMINHVNDKWIEATTFPTPTELGHAIRQAVIDTFDPQGAAPYDVVLTWANPSDMLNDPVFQARLLQWIEAGGLFVYTGWGYLPADTPLARQWPCRPTTVQSWMSEGAERTGGPELAGVPTQWISGWTFIPIPEATAGSQALANGQSGSAFLRRVGKGAIVSVPTGPFSRFHDVLARWGRKYDHDEIWVRFWDQSLHEITHSATAFPAYGDLRPMTNDVLTGKIVNRSAPEKLAVSVHVTTPQGRVVFSKEETVTVRAGETKPYELHIPIGHDWATGMYPVYLTVGHPAAKKQLHQSLEFIQVTGDLQLALVADKRGYRLGEEAALTLTASSRVPWSGELALGVYDFRGRLLAVDAQPASVTTNAQTFRFSYRMTDHGVRVDTFQAQLVARQDGQERGRAETKFYKYEPWSMRDEYQWSTWARIGCGVPAFVPQGMRLMAHAGMNSLGNPGSGGLEYAAERWGWRYYAEGIGINTFSPVIEYENDAEIEAQLLQEAKNTESQPVLTSAAYVIASLQEEGGFKGGWGQRYYWETPVAPDKACRAFLWFLKEKFPAIENLNAAWNTKYASWDEVKLTKEFSGTQPPPLEADGWAHPKASPLGAGVTGVSLAPYLDTAEFYNWYYDRIAGIAKRIFRDRINPVARVTASAPTIGTDKHYDVRISYPSCWNECQMDSVSDGPEPGYGLIWGHFDRTYKTENNLWGWLLVRSGHNDYWVDTLNFNTDLTHTRSSFAMRAWNSKFAGHERIILDSRPTPPEVGILDANGIGQDLNRKNMSTSLQVALNQGGFGLGVLNPTNLQPYKVVFAIGRRAVSRTEADQLAAYVETGGTLVITPGFAMQDQYGSPVTVSPGQGLAAKWQIEVTDRLKDSQAAALGGAQMACALDGVGESLRGLKLAGYALFREKLKSTGWTELARYDDGTPGVLTRSLGRGHLIWLNAIYQSHSYIQFVTPTDPPRQGFYRLVEWICTNAGVTRTLRVEGALDETLHLTAKQFTDPTGKIRYTVLRTSGEVPWVRGQFRWLGPQTTGYDVLGGEIGKPAPVVGRELALNVKPGAGRLLAYLEKPVKRIGLAVSPARLTTGASLRLTVQVRDADNQAVAGAFPWELRVVANGREIPGLCRSFSAADGGTLTLNTAVSDPAGTWEFTVTDGITGLSGSTKAMVKAAAAGPAFWPQGWPSEIQEPATLSVEKFLANLRALAELYRQDHSGDGWMVKQKLGYFYEYFPGTRHALLRPLNNVDWPNYRRALRDAVRQGDTFILTGEDLGVHPGTGLSTYPHHDAHQLEAVLAAAQGAKWSLVTPDGETVAAALGQGRLVLCRESIDAVAELNPATGRWQQRWLATQTARAPIPAPSAAKLRRWWTGQEAITRDPRLVTWFHDNYRELAFRLEPGKPVPLTYTPAGDAVWPTSTEGSVFCLVVPPTGEVKQVSVSVETVGNVPAQFDIGNDGTVDMDWTGAVARAARTTPYRDGSGWRIIPVRVTVTAPTEVKLSNLKIRVQ